MKLTRLNQKQKDHLQNVKNDILKKAFSTEGINKDACQKYFNFLYKDILKRKNDDRDIKIIYVQSPLQVQYAINFYVLAKAKYLSNKKKYRNTHFLSIMNEVMKEVHNEVENEVMNEVMNEVRNEVENEVWDEVMNEVRNEVMNEVMNEVRNEVWNEVWNEVVNEVRNEVMNEVENEVVNEVENEVWNEVENEVVNKNLKYFYGSYYFDFSNYSWISFYKVFYDFSIISDNKKFENYFNLSIESNIYQSLCLKNFVIVCRKPISILRDNQKRLHSYDFPAIEWEDGFKQYRIKGLQVPKTWVGFDKKITIDEIHSQENIELRRIGLELYGYDNYIKDTNAKCISSDEYGDLYKVEIQGDEPLVVVSVLNSSPEPEYMEGLETRVKFRDTEIKLENKFYKRYMLRVPPVPDEYTSKISGKKYNNPIKTPLQALAWSAQVTEDEYKNIEAES